MKQATAQKKRLISKDLSLASTLKEAFLKKQQMRSKVEFMAQEFVPVAAVLENGIKKQKLKNMELSQKYYLANSPRSSHDSNPNALFQRLTSKEDKEL